TVQVLDPGTPESPEGYRVRREHYELPDPGLHADELAALHLAASAVRMGDIAGTEALWKLGGAPAGGTTGDLAVELPGSGDLAVMFGAIAERQSLAFRY